MDVKSQTMKLQFLKYGCEEPNKEITAAEIWMWRAKLGNYSFWNMDVKS